MFRNVLSVLTLGLASTAHAGGAGAVYIDHATNSISVSVENVSGSPDLAMRELQVTSAAPQVHVDGDFGCPVGSTADSLELMFGAVYISYVSPPLLISIGAWDTSPELDLQGQAFGDFEIDHGIDIAQTWDSEAAITLGFNPVEIVESHIANADENDADLVAWMQSDQVFEAEVTMSAVVWCDNGQALFPGVGQVPLHVDIFFHGDRGIQYQPVAGGPTGVTSGGSGTPGYDSGAGTSGSGTGTGPTAPSTTAPSATTPSTTTATSATR